MNANVIIRQVRMNGCHAISFRDLGHLWPDSQGGWDRSAAQRWCFQNRLSLTIDDTIEKVWFGLAGIWAPAKM